MLADQMQPKRYLSAEVRDRDDFGDKFTHKPGEVVYDAVTYNGQWVCMTEFSSSMYHKTRDGVRVMGVGLGQKYVRQENGELHLVQGGEELLMEIKITVSTPNGFYADASARGSNLKSLLGRVIPVLKALPEEVDGSKQSTWNKIEIEVTR